MTELEDKIEIDAPAEDVFAWFMRLDRNYRSWHPAHSGCRWLKGEPFREGSVLCTEEELHGKRHRLRSGIRRIERNRLIEYSFLFPVSIISPGGSFAFENSGDGCLFTATITFRLGWLISKVFKSRMEGCTRHMREEGENLKRLLQQRWPA